MVIVCKVNHEITLKELDLITSKLRKNYELDIRIYSEDCLITITEVISAINKKVIDVCNDLTNTKGIESVHIENSNCER